LSLRGPKADTRHYPPLGENHIVRDWAMKRNDVMPLLMFLSVCSYWKTVNMEMMKSALQLLDAVQGLKFHGGHMGALRFWEI
jgi:hypothetical protein